MKRKLMRRLRDRAGQNGDVEAGLVLVSPADQEAKPVPGAEAVLFPVARPAQLRRRHYGLIASFVALVIVPTLAAIAYLYLIAEDQFASTVGLTIRSEETSSASELLGGLSALVTGGNLNSNAPLLVAFVQSPEIVARVDARLDLASHYGDEWWRDPLYRLWPNATIEDKTAFWLRMVRVSFDQGSGAITIEARARTPQMARAITEAIVEEAELMINALNAQARRDAMANAEADLEAALTRLRAAREALAAFRAENMLVDPAADIQGWMGVINNLQQQLAQALIEQDLLLATAQENDPRLRQAQRRIEVIEERLAEERRRLAASTPGGVDYPSLIARYESLRVDQEFAEETYRAALTAYDAARSNADRQSLYLATFIRPTLPESAEYPERALLSGLTFGFLTLVWSLLALIYYSLRDRG